MKDLIEQLKQNEKPFGLMSEEMQAKMRWLSANKGVRVIEGWSIDWYECQNNNFDAIVTYRLRADYTEDEYELCEIYTKGKSLCFEDLSGSGWMLEVAPRFHNFAGYLYEDGNVRSAISYRDDCKNHSPVVALEALKAGKEEPVRPTHVVFKKG